MCRPWKSTSSSASRVTQVTVGLTRITSSTALLAEVGSLAQQRATGRGAAAGSAGPGRAGCGSSPCRRTRGTPGPRRARARDSRSPSSVACTSVVTRSSRGCARRSATTSSTYSCRPVERRLDPRHLVADVDRERRAQVVGPVRDLLPVVVGQAEQHADDAGGVRLGELADELDRRHARRTRRSARRPAPGSAAASPRSSCCGRPASAAAGSGRGRRPRATSSVSCHQSENSPEWMPFCAGQRALPCRNRRSRSSALTSACRSTAQPQLVSTYQLSSRAACTARRGDVEGRVGEVEAGHGAAIILAACGSRSSATPASGWSTTESRSSSIPGSSPSPRPSTARARS